jgi:hypothetical protein
MNAHQSKILTFALLLICSFSLAQEKVHLKNRKMKISNTKVGYVKVELGEEVTSFSWDEELSDFLESSLMQAFNNSLGVKSFTDSLLIYFSNFELSFNPKFKEYGIGSGVFYFYEMKGDSLLKLGVVRELAETKVSLIPGLLIEKAFANIDFGRSFKASELKFRKTTLRDEKIVIGRPFEPNIFTQKPGVYLFYEDLKNNEPIYRLQGGESTFLNHSEYFSSIFYKNGLKLNSGNNEVVIDNFWGIYNGQDYYILLDKFLVRLELREDKTLSFKGDALSPEKTKNAPLLAQINPSPGPSISPFSANIYTHFFTQYISTLTMVKYFGDNLNSMAFGKTEFRLNFQNGFCYPILNQDPQKNN